MLHEEATPAFRNSSQRRNSAHRPSSTALMCQTPTTMYSAKASLCSPVILATVRSVPSAMETANCSRSLNVSTQAELHLSADSPQTLLDHAIRKPVSRSAAPVLL